jgi:hypothetical protein
MEAAKSATPVGHHYASCGLRAPVSSRRAADRAEVVGAEPLAARGSTIEKFRSKNSPIEIIVMPGVNQPRSLARRLCKTNEWCYEVAVLSSDICSKVREDFNHAEREARFEGEASE